MSVRRILVPLDGSGLSENALGFATALARSSGASIHILTVVPDPFLLNPGLLPPPFTDQITRAHVAVEKYVDERVEKLRDRIPGSVSGEVALGVPADAILNAIRRLNIDFVAMTSHGRGGFTRFWLGSVTDAVLRRSTVPVFVLRSEHPPKRRDSRQDPKISGVLVPLDGSALAEAALPPAMDLASLLDAPITLLMVLENPLGVSPGFAPYVVQYQPVVPFEQKEQAERYLERVANRIRSRGFFVDVATSDDLGVARAIIDFERRSVHGVIVIATNGRGGWKRLVMGSVADKVVRHAECPVLLVRPAEAPPRFGRPDRHGEWQRELTEFSRRNAARPVQIEIDMPALGAQREVEGLELTGAYYDPHEDRFVITVRGSGRSHLTHSILAPTRIDTLEDEGGDTLAVQHDGGQTLVRCAPPAASKPAATDEPRNLVVR